MGMSIDEAIRRIDYHNYIHQRREPRAIYITEAYRIATSIMRKYQKISNIIKLADDNELGYEYIGEKVYEVFEYDR